MLVLLSILKKTKVTKIIHNKDKPLKGSLHFTYYHYIYAKTLNTEMGRKISIFFSIVSIVSACVSLSRSDASLHSIQITIGVFCIVAVIFLYLSSRKKEENEATINDTENNLQDDFEHFELGKMYYNQQYFSEAAIHFEKFLEIKKVWLEAFILLAYCYHYEGNMKKTLKNYAEALEINPRNIEILPRYAQLLIEIGDEPKAEDVCVYAMEVEVANAEIFHTYACLLQKKEEHKKACWMFEQASKAYDNEHIENIDIYVDWSESLLELDQQISASSMLFKALEQDPRYERALEVSKKISI